MTASPATRVLRSSIVVAFPTGMLLAVGLALLSTQPAHALITGGCTATAQGSVSGSIDLTKARDWNLVNADVVTGHGDTPNGQSLTGVTVQIDQFGIGIPILSNSQTGTGGNAGPYTVSDFSRYIRILGASGSAGNGTCTGSIKITVTDVSALATVAGIGGAALGAVGVLGLLGLLFSHGGIGARIGGALLGLLGGTGLGVLLQQMGTLSPSSLYGLIVPAAGVVLGVALPGLFGRR